MKHIVEVVAMFVTLTASREVAAVQQPAKNMPNLRAIGVLGGESELGRSHLRRTAWLGKIN